MSDTVDGPEAGFLGLLACVSFGRRSTFFAGPRASDVSFLALGRGLATAPFRHDGPRYHLAAETESD